MEGCERVITRIDKDVEVICNNSFSWRRDETSKDLDIQRSYPLTKVTEVDIHAGVHIYIYDSNVFAAQIQSDSHRFNRR